MKKLFSTLLVSAGFAGLLAEQEAAQATEEQEVVVAVESTEVQEEAVCETSEQASQFGVTVNFHKMYEKEELKTDVNLNEQFAFEFANFKYQGHIQEEGETYKMIAQMHHKDELAGEMEFVFERSQPNFYITFEEGVEDQKEVLFTVNISVN